MPATEIGPAIALQTPLANAVPAVTQPCLHNHKGPVRLLARVHEHGHHSQLLAAVTLHVQVESPLPPLKQSLDGLCERERVPATAFEVHLLLYYIPPISVALLLVVHLDPNLPPTALLQDIRQQFQVKPQAGLYHKQVLVAFIGDEKVEADTGGGEAICREAGEQAKLIQGEHKAMGEIDSAAQCWNANLPHSWKTLLTRNTVPGAKASDCNLGEAKKIISH